jgi:hypothetical protein
MNALDRATKLNRAIDEEVAKQIFGEPSSVLTAIRSFLLEHEQQEVANNFVTLVKMAVDRDMAEIVMGPQIDKGPSDSHFRFDSGARLSFGITLKKEGRRSQVISYRFHYVFKTGHSPSFLRFDLNLDGTRPPL